MTNREIAEIALTAIGLGGAYLFFRHSILFKERTLDEVIGYLRKLDWQEMSRLFDPAEEEKLIGFWTRRDFRRSQRARLDLAREFVECMYYDNRILFQWANTEHKDMRKHHLQYEPATVESILRLIDASRRFRRVALLALWKIRFLSFLHFDKLHFLRVPGVAALRNVGNTDLLRTFQSVKEAAVALAGVYGEECALEILAAI